MVRNEKILVIKKKKVNGNYEKILLIAIKIWYLNSNTFILYILNS